MQSTCGLMRSSGVVISLGIATCRVGPRRRREHYFNLKGLLADAQDDLSEFARLGEEVVGGAGIVQTEHTG